MLRVYRFLDEIDLFIKLLKFTWAMLSGIVSKIIAGQMRWTFSDINALEGCTDNYPKFLYKTSYFIISPFP